MKARLVAFLVLVIAGFALVAMPVQAKPPVPGIKQTPAFKKMKGYVGFLYGKRDKPVTRNKRKTYRSNLGEYRKNADLKALQLYSRTLIWISKQDDAQQRRQIRRIRVNQKRQVQAQQRRLSRRLGSLRSKQNAAVQRIYNQYQPQINNLADQRDNLKRQLNRTTNPDRRAKLITKINSIQTRINGVVSDRSTDVSAVNSRYNARSSSVTRLFNARIAKVRAQARKLIRQSRNAWRRTFRTQVEAAKTRRDAEQDLVSAVAERGSGYIDAMPPAGK